MRVCVGHIPHPIPFYGLWINRYFLLHSSLLVRYMGSLVSIDSVLEEYLQGLPIERDMQMRCVLDGAVACCVVVVDCWRILCTRVSSSMQINSSTDPSGPTYSKRC